MPPFSLLPLSFVLLLSTVIAASGQSPSLIGSWKGSGIVQPHNGAREKARCRASIRKAAGRGLYHATYRCASSLGMATQSVILRKSGSNRYSGSFYNPQHNVRGRISITLGKNRQSVSLTSTKGRGWMNLSRR